MNLKDTFTTDLDTFFNPNEFGSPSLIDGKSVMVILDDDSLKEYNFIAEGEGLAVGELLFHVPVLALDDKPFIEKRVRIDTKLYEIIDIKENIGVYTIVFIGYRS